VLGFIVDDSARKIESIGSRDDDAGFFALRFLRLRELGMEEFGEAAGARAAVGANQAHPIEEDEQMEDVDLFQWRLASLLDFLFYIGEQRRDRGVEFAGDNASGLRFVVDGGRQRFLCFRQRLQRGENVGVVDFRMRGIEFRDREGQRGH